MRAKLTLILAVLAISASGLQAQTPAQPMARAPGSVTNTTPLTPVAVAATKDGDATATALLQTLLQLKAANDEILKRQTATLSQLEEVSKAAEQLKVYATRG